jgi:tRNA modification GTPase
MERTRDQIEAADFCLLVADASAPPPVPPAYLAEMLVPRRALLVLNKSDLPAHAATSALLPDLPRAAVSAKTGAGISDFKALLASELERGGVVPDGTEMVVGERHAAALRAAAEKLRSAATLLRKGAPAELAASDARLALDDLAEITGRVDNERMLDKLFATFCIGK